MAVRTAAIRLREDRFDVMTRVLGCVTYEACAELLGVDPKTVTRARRGAFGVAFIARTLAALAGRREELAAYNLTPSFEELFEVVEVEVGRRRGVGGGAGSHG